MFYSPTAPETTWHWKWKWCEKRKRTGGCKNTLAFISQFVFFFSKRIYVPKIRRGYDSTLLIYLSSIQTCQYNVSRLINVRHQYLFIGIGAIYVPVIFNSKVMFRATLCCLWIRLHRSKSLIWREHTYVYHAYIQQIRKNRYVVFDKKKGREGINMHTIATYVSFAYVITVVRIPCFSVLNFLDRMITCE